MAGLVPVRTASRIALRTNEAVLRAYQAPGGSGSVLLLVPAPIKRAWIWDLAPWASVVRCCTRGGIRVYAVEWQRPKPYKPSPGLADYADRLLLDCVITIASETRCFRLFLAGHSLGGTLTAIFTALYPQHVQGLILVGAPLHFAPQVGALDRLVALSPHADRLTGYLGDVPGSFLDLVACLADPAAFGWSRWIDWLASMSDPIALRTHLLVQRWSLDEIPLPRRLFEEIVEQLYRGNCFMRDRLTVGAKRATPAAIEAPILAVMDARCRVAPPASMLPFLQAVRSQDKRVLWYEPEPGVALQHLGPLVGRNAHRSLWPQILGWIEQHGEGP